MSQSNVSFSQKINSTIKDFVSDPSREMLRAGTGSFSTPFRGSLFGEVDAEKIDAELTRRERVDVLWMGSNPNVPESLARILEPFQGQSLFDSFHRQMHCGMYSEQNFVGDTVQPGWDPIHYASNRGWKIYSELISKIGDINSVAMANFVVWGSANFEEFLSKIKLKDANILKEILEFSIKLNYDIVCTLRPKLIIVPFSLGRCGMLKGIAPEYLTLGSHCDEYKLQGQKRDFKFYVQRSPTGIPVEHILHVPHPSSLRLSATTEQEVCEAILSALKIR